jgi:hypothetical protein
MSTRRDAIKQFFSFAATLGVFPAAAQGPEEAAHEHRRLGIRALRFLNTAEHWNRDRAGKFVPFRDLAGSPAIAELRTNKRAIMKGIGSALIDDLRFDEEVIVPGWRLNLAVTEGGGGYEAVLEDLSPFRVGNMSTDTAGRILSDNPTGKQAVAVRPRSRPMMRAVAYVTSIGFAQGCGSVPYRCDPFSEFGCWYSGLCCACVGDNCCVDCFSFCCNYYTAEGWCVNCGCQGCIWDCTSNSGCCFG